MKEPKEKAAPTRAFPKKLVLMKKGEATTRVHNRDVAHYKKAGWTVAPR